MDGEGENVPIKMLMHQNPDLSITASVNPDVNP
jgi:hypothetical protein